MRSEDAHSLNVVEILLCHSAHTKEGFYRLKNRFKIQIIGPKSAWDDFVVSVMFV